MKVEDIFNLKEGLNILSDQEFSISTAYKIQKVIIKVDEEFKVASDLRMKIIEKYKDPNSEEGKTRIKKDKLDIYNKEMIELSEQKVDIKLDKINLTDLGDSIKPRTLVLIDKIIKEEK